MLSGLYQLARPVLFALAPEDAHEATLKALEAGLYPRGSGDDKLLQTKVMGLEFPNPLGLAAGYDKDGRVPDAVLGLGFGFSEIGTVTPRPQSGNPRPRVFRLVADDALVNRLGFNNAGHDAALARLRSRVHRGGVVGVNIGANKDSVDRAADYVQGIDKFSGVASYFAINISSPNTPGLRDLQAPAALNELLTRVMGARERQTASGGSRRPIVVKISPDLDEDDIEPICDRLLAHQVDAIAVSNTTLSRAELASKNSSEAGGLSGRPLFNRSTSMLARIFRMTGGAIPLIGVGGIDSPGAALAKIEAGATLLQLYTGLVFQGPGLICMIKTHLAATLQNESCTSIAPLVGRKAEQWASRALN